MKRSPMTLRPRRCQWCKERLEKVGPVIHEACIEPWVADFKRKKALEEQKDRKAAAKVERAQFKARKEKLKTFSEWEDECRAIVQKIARLRDRHDGCISCPLPATWGGQWHGSHFRSHGACTALQFHLWNIHKSCSPCNRDKGGNLHGYRPRLIAKIGADRVAWLEAQNGIVKHTPDYLEYLKRFKRVMGKRLRRMEKRMEAEPCT
jgi:hypothetical protein